MRACCTDVVVERANLPDQGSSSGQLNDGSVKAVTKWGIATRTIRKVANFRGGLLPSKKEGLVLLTKNESA